MGRSLIKGRKRCPVCKSTEIYKRLRRRDYQIKEHYIHRNTHRNRDLKAYLCQNCRHEFDVPTKIW